MNEILSSTPFLLFLVLASYLSGTYIYTKSKIALLHPIIISIAIIIGVLKWAGIDYETFSKGSYMIHFMLGPSVVALGYVLYEQIGYLKGKVLSITSSIIVGSLVGIVSVIWICKLMGVEHSVIVSLEPKSVTTPIALSLSAKSGGIPSLTAITVVICGILGGIIGPFILRKLHIKSRVAKGLALGAAAHGYVDGVRDSNYTSLEEYMAKPHIHECGRTLSMQEKLEEEIFLGFRKRSGVNVSEIDQKYGIDFGSKYRHILDKYSDFIEKTPSGYTFNLKGTLISNIILSEFI